MSSAFSVPKGGLSFMPARFGKISRDLDIFPFRYDVARNITQLISPILQGSASKPCRFALVFFLISMFQDIFVCFCLLAILT